MTDTAFELPEPDDRSVFPEFRIAVFNHPFEVGLEVGMLEQPAITRHASPALLYGLAIMTLEQQGVIDAEINRLLHAGPINEIDACNRITLLLTQDANVDPV